MKAKDLRIGNWIKYESFEDAGYYQVEEICKDSEGFEGYYIKYRNGSFATSLEEDEEDKNKMIQPIPLTEEWLLKFGFEPKGTEPIMFTNGRYNYFPSSKYFGNTRNNGGLIHSNVRHVHQLQNRYFALTGEELKIEE